MQAAFRAVPVIQEMNDHAAEEEARLADQLLESYISNSHAQNKDSSDPRTSNGPAPHAGEAPRERYEHR